MGFVRRLNSRDLVNDPCNGAEVYPITATNAVYREGSGENLEDILTRLGNSADRKVVQDISYISNTNKLHKEFTDNTTEDITLSTTGTLKTDNNDALTPSSSESFSDNINLHKVSKTGNYNDLLNLPAGLGAYPVISAEYDSTEDVNIITFHKEISNRISTITLTPTIDSNNRRQLYKCRIVNDGTTDPLNWTEGNVLVKLPKDSTYTPYLLVSTTSGPDSQPSEMINSHHFDNAVFTTQESVSLSEHYNVYPIQAHINWVTRSGHVNTEEYYTTLFKCFSNNTVTFDLLSIKGYYLMIPVDTPVPVANYGGIGKMKYISETDYNNLTYKDPDCLYFIPVENS